MDVKVEKSRLREEALSKRKTMDKAIFKSLNEALVSHLVAYLKAQACTRVAIFYPLIKEVDLRALNDHFKTYYPIIEQGVLTFAPHVGRFVEAPFKTHVPDTDLRLEGCLDAVIVPGLWFDEQGYRLGYGKGYYDGFLKTFPGLRIGVVFDCFRYPVLPTEAHDEKVNVLVTPTQVTIF